MYLVEIFKNIRDVSICVCMGLSRPLIENTSTLLSSSICIHACKFLVINDCSNKLHAFDYHDIEYIHMTCTNKYILVAYSTQLTTLRLGQPGRKKQLLLSHLVVAKDDVLQT